MWNPVRPRDRSNPRYARVDNRDKTIGEGGVLYMLDEGQNQHKFKTISEEEEMREIAHYTRVYSETQRKNMRASRSRTQSPAQVSLRHAQGSPRHVRGSGDSMSIGPPRQADSPATRKSLDRSPGHMHAHMKRLSGSIGRDDSPAIRAVPPKSMHMVRRNSASNLDVRDSRDSRERPPRTRRDVRDGGDGVPQSYDARLAKTVDTLSGKYEENLEVIQKLQHEKREMERRMKEAEAKLYYGKSRSTLRDPEDNDGESADSAEVGPEVGTPPRRPSSAGPRRSFSAGRGSHSSMLHRGSRATDDLAPGARSLDLERRVSGRAYAGSGSLSKSMNIDDRRRSRSAGPAGSRRSSTYAPLSPLGPQRMWDIAPSLQADQDRFVARRRALERSEKEHALREEDELNYARERSKKAAEMGTEFAEMKQRDEEQNRKKHARLERKKKELQDKEELIRTEKRKEWLKHLNKPIPKMEYSWKELSEQEDEARKARIEERKNILAASAINPFPDAYESKVKRMQAQREEEFLMNRITKPRNCIDFTSTKTGKLSTSGLEDDGDDDGTKDNPESSGKRPKTSKPSKQVLAMEKRLELIQEKKKEREERKRQKEAETNALKVATERRKIERMMNARLPDSKPTRVFEKRTEWVRSKLDKEREDQQNEETVMKQRQEREKKLGEYLRTLIDVNEEERKNKYPGYTSLSATQRNAAQRAAEGKASYRAAYKANQRRLQEVAETRPTLIERHDRSVGAMQAANAALQKVAECIGEATHHDDGKYNSDDDDFFDDDEKMILRAKQGAKD